MIADMTTTASVMLHCTNPTAPSNTIAKLTTTAPSNDPNETKRVSQITPTMRGNANSTGGYNDTAAPAPVAIPFPPRNPISGDQQ